LPRRGADFLSVEEMARVLIGDAKRQRFEGRGESKGGEKFGDIARFCTKCGRLLMLGFVVRKKVGVFLECRAAACGVGDNGVEIFAKEGGEILAREIARDVAHSRVSGESAAAQLAGRDDDFAAVGREDADSGFVELREGNLCDAAGEEGDAARRLPQAGNLRPSWPKKKESSMRGRRRSRSARPSSLSAPVARASVWMPER
jgi:hypothetical protein